MCCYGASVSIFMWTDNCIRVSSVCKNRRFFFCKPIHNYQLNERIFMILYRKKMWNKSVQAVIQAIACMNYVQVTSKTSSTTEMQYLLWIKEQKEHRITQIVDTFYSQNSNSTGQSIGTGSLLLSSRQSNFLCYLWSFCPKDILALT